MKQIAICMVTYNRAEIVKDVLIQWLKAMDSAVADILVYDSSTNEDTREFVEGIAQKEKHVSYIRINSEVHSSKKVYDIYQNAEIQNNYSYVWIVPDYFSFSREVIEKAEKHLDEGCDMLMMNFRDSDHLGDKLYIDRNEVFYRYAWALTQYGIVILNSNTVLKKADWNYLTRKYLGDETRNFSHVAMYFEVLAWMDEIQFYHIEVERKDWRVSKQIGTSRYLSEYFEVWGKYWPNTIYQLPDVYTDKTEAIKRHSRYSGALNVANLALLRKENVLTHQKFWQYRKNWKKISAASGFMLFWSAYAPVTWVEYIGEHDGFGNTIATFYNRLALSLFCLRHKNLYIYGAGALAKRCATYLDTKKISYEGFLVTNLDDNVQKIFSHPVFEMSQMGYQAEIGIILAVNDKNREEILPVLYQFGYKKEIYVKQQDGKCYPF